jgi:hypothetical protein
MIERLLDIHHHRADRRAGRAARVGVGAIEETSGLAHSGLGVLSGHHGKCGSRRPRDVLLGAR